MASREIGLEVNADKTKYMVMSGDQNAGRSHSIKLATGPLKGWESSDIWKNPNESTLYSDKLRECLLSFGTESFVFQFANQKYKGTQNYNFACCFVWV